MSPRATICVFAKPPRAGEVKTRLAPRFGLERAAMIAQALLEDAITAAMQVNGAHVVLSVTSPFDLPPFPAVPQWSQPDGDLGSRIESSMHRALAGAPCAVAIGADTPGLRSELIEAAIQQLESCDAVLGPTEDGGYYLLAMKRCPVGLLQGVRWSQTYTLSDTIHQLNEFGYSHLLAERWFDLDTMDDFERARMLLQRGKLLAPHLAAAIDRCEMIPGLPR